MPPAAINIIAIAIFAMTMSSLLSPILNISPAIPAIATFSILTLATVDAARWRGKGFGMLLDLFASEEQRDRVLRHEAGHFLIACLYDIPITGYALSAWEAFRQGQPGRGGVSFAPVELNAQLPAVEIERYLTVLMAGIAAERLVYGKAEGGEEDREQLQIALTKLGRSPRSFSQQENWSILQAKTLLEDRWQAYEALVNAMKQRASVADCLQAIELWLNCKS